MRPCIVMLENARSIILHEMTNYLLCMSPLKTNSDIPSSVVPVHKIMNSLSRAFKMMQDIIYSRPRLEYAKNLVSLIF